MGFQSCLTFVIQNNIFEIWLLYKIKALYAWFSKRGQDRTKFALMGAILICNFGRWLHETMTFKTRKIYISQKLVIQHNSYICMSYLESHAKNWPIIKFIKVTRFLRKCINFQTLFNCMDSRKSSSNFHNTTKSNSPYILHKLF